MPGHLRGTGRRGGWPSLPRGTAGRLHRVGEVAAARPHGRGHVDGGQGVGPRHADQFHLPPLQRGTQGRSPRPVGLPGVGKCQRDMAPLPQRRGDGNPPPGAAPPVAILPAESGLFPPPTGARGGPGTPGRVPVPPLRHVPGGPCCPHGSQPGNQPGHGDSLFPDQPRLRPRNPYPWDDFVGPLPGDTIRHQPRLQPGTPPD